jgi:hypothetical protein
MHGSGTVSAWRRACSARLSSYQSNERIIVYEIPDVSHFDVEVGRPYLSYGRHFRGIASLAQLNLVANVNVE